MKKLWSILFLVAVIGVLAACGNVKEEETSAPADVKSVDAKEVTTLKVGAASVPHGEVLEFLADDLKAEGIEIEIAYVQDGIQTNQLTADGELDFNYFQHTPYLNQVNTEAGLDLVNIAGIHIEPFGVYSKEISAIDELPEKAKVAIPNDPVNFSRALLLFASNDIIELDANHDGVFGIEHITKNDKNIEFISVDAPLLNRSLDDVDAAAINTNYALEGGLNPTKDALIIENADSPYVNIVVTTPERKDDPAIQAVVKWLTSEKARDFFESKYEGAVVPVF
ncbi:MAG: MetQ/NlpA family ABC transporter substrate-binding protein [Solibacillus sp.]